MSLLITLAFSIPITFGNFDFCGEYQGMHWRTIVNEQVVSRIEMCENDNKFQLKLTLIHELGHEFWFAYLTDEEREAYKNLQTDNRADYYRDYSQTNELEDFADNFANIMLGRDWLNLSDEYRAKQQFIRDLISKYE